MLIGDSPSYTRTEWLLRGVVWGTTFVSRPDILWVSRNQVNWGSNSQRKTPMSGRWALLSPDLPRMTPCLPPPRTHCLSAFPLMRRGKHRPGLSWKVFWISQPEFLPLKGAGARSLTSPSAFQNLTIWKPSFLGNAISWHKTAFVKWLRLMFFFQYQLAPTYREKVGTGYQFDVRVFPGLKSFKYS